MPSNRKAAEPTYRVRALERGLRVLCAFTDGTTQASLQDLNETLDLDKATLLRLLSVLENMEFIQHDPESGTYRLGIRAFEVGCAFLPNLPIEQLAQPYLQELSEKTGQTANLGVLSGDEVVHVATVVPDRPLRFHNRVGLRDALYCTGLGKTLAAQLAHDDLEAYLEQTELVPRTQFTISDPAAFRAEMVKVRESDFAEDREENVIGLRCLAAPVRNAVGEVVAAVSISGLAHEYAEPHMSLLLAQLRDCTETLSRRLGHMPSR